MSDQPSPQEPYPSEVDGLKEPSDATETSSEASQPRTTHLDSIREAATLAPPAEGITAPWMMPQSSEEAATLLPPPGGSFSQTDLPAASTWIDADHQGTKWGSYHRVESVGSWRFGELFHAEHLQLHRKVLLIVLSPEWSANPEIRSWFIETAKSVGSIQDRHLSAAVLEFGMHEEAIFIATPLPGDSAEEFYRRRAAQAIFPKESDPICDAFIALLRGVKAMHQAGISHGAIQGGNLFLSNSADGVRFLPFAYGIPQVAWIDLEKKIPVQPKNAFASDYQALALEFIRLLLGHRNLSMPAKPSLRWLRRTLPFISPKLAKLLFQMSRRGLRFQDVEPTLKKLDSVRREILVPVSWGTRFLHLISELGVAFLLQFFSLMGIGLFVLLAASTPTSPGGQTAPTSASSLLFRLVVLLPWLSLPAIYLFWEPIFNTTFARHSLQCQLIDTYNGRPAIWRRFVRSFSRIGLWFVFYCCILVVTSINSLSPGTWVSSLLLILGPLIAMCLVYTTAPLFGGVPFHDWISGTRWVQFRRVDDGHSIAIADAQSRSQTLLSERSTNAAEGNESETIGDIRLQRELGQGGMGTVYLGYDRVLNRSVAVKVTMAGEHESREAIERFRREAKLAAKLDHPNITKVYRVGMWKNQPFMEMEYVDGETFQQVVKRDGSIPVEQAWNWILQAAIGLREAANQGVIHRDIKPSNLMVSKEGLVKVMDFGISKSIDEELESDQPESPTMSESSTDVEPWLADVLDLDDPNATLNPSGKPIAPWMKAALENNPSLTRTGAMLGTPQYMSPEQAQCKQVDARSDIYSLGLTLYYLLAGRPAFESPSMYDLLMRQCSEPPPPLDDQVLGDKQREVLERMIAKRPEDRYKDYQQLIDALQATQAPEDRVPGRNRRMNASLIDVVVLLSLYIAVFALPSEIMTCLSGIALSVIYLIGIPCFLGDSLSHRCFRLVVQTRRGEIPHWIRSSLRQLAKYGPFVAFIYWMTFVVFLEMGGEANGTATVMIVFPLYAALGFFSIYCIISYYAVAAWNLNRRAIHDLLAGTRIVYRPPSGNKSKSRRPLRDREET
jgi:serine/threonine protein kinase